MGANKYLTKRAKEVIVEKMRDNGEMTKAEIADLVRPHFLFDLQELKEQAINRYVGRLVSQLRDDDGTRTSFVLRGENLVVNVDKSVSLLNVTAVKEQLRKQIVGTLASYRKTRKRESELAGQISMFELLTAAEG